MKRLAVYLLSVFAIVCLFSGELKAQKKALDHEAYDAWESISSIKLSDDGSIVAYQIRPQQGDSRLVFKRLPEGQEVVVERGTDLVMPGEGKYAVFSIKAPYDSTRQARIDGKKSEEMPRDSVAYINLETFEVVNIGAAKSFKTGQDSNPYVFAVSYEEKKGESGNNKEKKAEPKGDNVLMINTSTGEIDTLRSVLSFSVSRTGEKVVAVVEKQVNDSTVKKAVKFYDFSSGKSAELSSGKEEYAELAFNYAGDKLLFMATEQKEKESGSPAWSLFVTEQISPRKTSRNAPVNAELRTTELITPESAGIPEGWVVSDKSKPKFSNSSERIILDLQRYFPPKDTTVIDFEAPRLDIWVWNKLDLPPMHKAGGRGVQESLKAMVSLNYPDNLMVLSLNPEEQISIPSGGDADFALSTDRGKYSLRNLWAAQPQADYSLIELSTGKRKSVVDSLKGRVSLSPEGKYLMWFNSVDGNWYCKDLHAGGDFVNLTGKTGYNFYDEEDDHSAGFVPVSQPVWIEGDAAVLITDSYDVWRFSPDGKKMMNLTAGHGRENKIKYAIERIGFEPEPYLYSKPFTLKNKGTLYLSASGTEDMTNGFARAKLSASSKPTGFTAEYSYTSPIKAENADFMVYTKGNFNEPMDLYLSSENMQSETKLSSINPQQQDYLWGDARLVHWEAYDGTPLKGLLFTPENLDSSQKYPMLVYFYEKNSSSLYNYRSPAPSRSIINIPYCVSQGYVVFVPDIVYEVGHPGESAYNCICSGVEAMCEQFGFINKGKVAIQGQSWGGYQVAYLVTRTDMFAAAGAGAPVGNMTSAYGGIRWESGNSRIPQYEYGQSRIGKTLWEEGGLDLYIENSPIFFADKVKTPVLIMHNDADGAVPWYQGIEFFMVLRRLGKPAWLLQYNEEAHNLSERRNSKDLSIRLQQFFDYYLKDAPEPVWMKSGIPHERKGNYFGYEYAE